MSYSTIDALYNDALFGGRVRACTEEQAQVFVNDARPDYVALSNDILRSGGGTTNTFIRLTAAAPGIAEAAEGSLTSPIDQELVLDEMILSAVQGNWQLVASLYFDAEGNPVN
jgi:hypothetical protein